MVLRLVRSRLLGQTATGRPYGRPIFGGTGLGDFLPAGAGNNHRFVHRTKLSVVIHRKFGPALRFTTDPSGRKLPGWTIASGQGLGAYGMFIHTGLNVCSTPLFPFHFDLA
jgi:hypothetical protein